MCSPLPLTFPFGHNNNFKTLTPTLAMLNSPSKCTQTPAFMFQHTKSTWTKDDSSPGRGNRILKTVLLLNLSHSIQAYPDLIYPPLHPVAILFCPPPPPMQLYVLLPVAEGGGCPLPRRIGHNTLSFIQTMCSGRLHQWLLESMPCLCNAFFRSSMY